MKVKSFFVSILFFSVVNIYCQNIIKIYVDSEAECHVGKTLVQKVKEEFRESKSFDLIWTENDEPKFVVKLITMDRCNGDNESVGRATIYALILIFDNVINSQGLRYAYLTNYLGFSGSNRIKEVATSLVAYTLEVITNILETIQRNN